MIPVFVVVAVVSPNKDIIVIFRFDAATEFLIKGLNSDNKHLPHSVESVESEV